MKLNIEEELEKAAKTSVQLEYVMGKKNCLKLETKSETVYNIMLAYGKYFRACKIAELTLHNDLQDLVKGLH